LGTVRVMKTCGMMGEVVGRAASLCAIHDCAPRDVYERYYKDLDRLLHLPGKARRATLDAAIEIPDDAPPLAGAHGPPTGLDPKTLPGTVIDDTQAEKQGKWTAGTGLKGYVGWSYLYAAGDSGASARFVFKAPETGRFEIRLAYQPHENRGTSVPVKVQTADGDAMQRIDMRKSPPIDGGFISLGEFDLSKGEEASVVVSAQKAGGNVHADAVQVVKVP
jgi:hypothetical protein